MYNHVVLAVDDIRGANSRPAKTYMTVDVIFITSNRKKLGPPIYFCSRWIVCHICVFNFNFLALVVSEILRGGSQIYTRGAYTPLTPPSEEIFLRKASTSQYLIVFLISN